MGTDRKVHTGCRPPPLENINRHGQEGLSSGVLGVPMRRSSIRICPAPGQAQGRAVPGSAVCSHMQPQRPTIHFFDRWFLRLEVTLDRAISNDSARHLLATVSPIVQA
jgi:hypothetical protein